MNVEDVDGVDYTLRMKRIKSEFAMVVVEKSRKRTGKGNECPPTQLIFLSSKLDYRSKIRRVNAASGSRGARTRLSATMFVEVSCQIEPLGIQVPPVQHLSPGRMRAATFGF
jgi:hypothetical protein